MSDFGEETYSTIFTSLKHPVRRKILRMLSEKPRNFSEILEALGISSSHLTYHLENLGELVSKTEDGKYKLSTFGEAAVGTMSKVEEAPKVTETKRPPALPIKWKSFFAVLMIGLVVLAGVCYVQYRSLNRLSAEYEQLKELVELVEKGASLVFEYTLRYRVVEFEPHEPGLIGIRALGSHCCAVYSPYDNVTLDLVLSIRDIPSEGYIPISVREGNVFDLGTNETAPVIWSANVTLYNIFSVPLASKGWYTISLFELTTFTHPFTGKTLVSRTPLEEVECEMSLRIIYEGKYSPFIAITHPLKS